MGIKSIIIIISSLSASIVLNFVLWKIWIEKKVDILRSVIKSDRWGTKRIPLTGGIVIFLVYIVVLLIQGIDFSLDNKMLVTIFGASACFILGLVDDIIELKSYQKFLGQIIITSLVVAFGVQFKFYTDIINILVTFLWILGITNAFNLIDNIDGLAGGIAIIASSFLGVTFYLDGFIVISIYLFSFAAVLLGFLIFNFKPAKIYLGDSGSLFIGFFLSSITAMSSHYSSGKSLAGIIIFPVILFILPILDTTLVSVTRQLRGQSPFQGGRDHLSHRLILLGLSERQVVILLYIVSFILGLSIFFLRNVPLILMLLIYFFISVFIFLFGFNIGRIKLKESKDNIQKDSIKSTSLKSTLLYKNRILQIIIDIALLCAIYYFSYFIKFGQHIDQNHIGLLTKSIGFVIGIKIILLNVFDIYSIEVRFFSLKDALKVLYSLTIGSAFVIVFLTLVYSFSPGGFSRAVFIIDWMLSLIVIIGIKFFYKIFNELFYPFAKRNTVGYFFLGDIDTYKAIDQFIKTKENIHVNIASHISIDKISIDNIKSQMLKKNIKNLIIERKYKKLLGSQGYAQLTDSNINICNEKDFIIKNLL